MESSILQQPIRVLVRRGGAAVRTGSMLYDSWLILSKTWIKKSTKRNFWYYRTVPVYKMFHRDGRPTKSRTAPTNGVVAKYTSSGKPPLVDPENNESFLELLPRDRTSFLRFPLKWGVFARDYNHKLYKWKTLLATSETYL